MSLYHYLTQKKIIVLLVSMFIPGILIILLTSFNREGLIISYPPTYFLIPILISSLVISLFTLSFDRPKLLLGIYICLGIIPTILSYTPIPINLQVYCYLFGGLYTFTTMILLLLMLLPLIFIIIEIFNP